jgi:sugar phosphate isomerase/epimerase
MLKIGIQTAEWLDLNAPETFFKMASEAGFDAVEFSADALLPTLRQMTKDPANVASILEKSEEELAEVFAPVKAAAKAYGITVAQLAAPTPRTVADRDDITTLYKLGFDRALWLCSYLEAPVLTLSLPTADTRAKEREANLALLREAAAVAKKSGFKIALTNAVVPVGARFYEGPALRINDALFYIDTLNAELGETIFGACYNTGNANLVPQKPLADLTTLGERVIALQVGDNNRDYDIRQIPYTQSNRVSPAHQFPFFNWENFIKGLAACKYQGVLCFDVRGVANDFPPPLHADAMKLTAAVGRYMAAEAFKE